MLKQERNRVDHGNSRGGNTHHNSSRNISKPRNVAVNNGSYQEYIDHQLKKIQTESGAGQSSAWCSKRTRERGGLGEVEPYKADAKSTPC